MPIRKMPPAISSGDRVDERSSEPSGMILYLHLRQALLARK
jgi:hypothetical protein